MWRRRPTSHGGTGLRSQRAAPGLTGGSECGAVRGRATGDAGAGDEGRNAVRGDRNSSWVVVRRGLAVVRRLMRGPTAKDELPCAATGIAPGW
jgi:hypothetical protein